MSENKGTNAGELGKKFTEIFGKGSDAMPPGERAEYKRATGEDIHGEAAESANEKKKEGEPQFKQQSGHLRASDKATIPAAGLKKGENPYKKSAGDYGD
jgi:hypothetical protein